MVRPSRLVVRVRRLFVLLFFLVVVLVGKMVQNEDVLGRMDDSVVSGFHCRVGRARFDSRREGEWRNCAEFEVRETCCHSCRDCLVAHARQFSKTRRQRSSPRISCWLFQMVVNGLFRSP